MSSLYRWIEFLHVVAGITFMVSHGASIAISFRIKKEQEMNKIKTMLDLSGTMWVAMMLSLLVTLIAGIIMGFMLKWWSQWWIWISIILLLVIMIWMFQIGQSTYHPIRRAMGMPYLARGREMPAEEPAPEEERKALIARSMNPYIMLLVGYGGYVVIIWLMMFKPF